MSETSNERLVIDPELIARYDKSGPRYTSYPTAPAFTEDFGPADYVKMAQQSNDKGGPLSIYVHLPFCNTVCFYCGCNKIVTKDRSRAAPYLDELYKEIAMQGALFDSSRIVDQLHWGGGTPTFISHDEMRELMDQTRTHFNLRDDDEGEYSIEIDPREAREGTLALLRELGFNRMSMGVQDFDPAVQKAVNRIQPKAVTLAVLDEARALGFRSINMDLIYGLPHQDHASFTRTLDAIIEASPDRISVFNYAHLPERFKPQRRINAEDLPSAAEKLKILQGSIDQLTAAGYVYIGMDHFAKPTDELALAQQNGTLTRNFQGYATHAECDLVALGITSIGAIGSSFSQNVRTIEEYSERLASGVIPVFRGMVLNDDDLLRQYVIRELICHFHLAWQNVVQRFGIQVETYFAEELRALETMASDGLLRMDGDGIQVLNPGKLLIRNICMVFDVYSRNSETQFSKVI